MRRTTIAGIAIAIALGVAAFAGVGSDNPDLGPPAAGGAASTGPPAPVKGTIRIAAAPSLTRVMNQLADSFELANPGTKVLRTFVSSPQIAAQVTNHIGNYDVVALDSAATMTSLRDKNLVRPEVPLAGDTLAIVVAKGNPLGIHTLKDLANGDRRVVLCAIEVPCGRLATAVLAAAHVNVVPVERSTDGEDALAKVVNNEADAAIVWSSEASGSGGERVAIDAARQFRGALAIAVARHPRRAALGEAFLSFVETHGQDALRSFGFAAPVTSTTF